MGRILAIDYGKKRVGVAVTDPLKLIANGVSTVPTSEIKTFLEDYIQQENVEKLVIGFPKQMNNQPSENVKYIQPFLAWIRNHFPDIDLELYDERFTSKIAERTLIDGGVRKMARRNKNLIDKISAVLILESYLDYQKNKLNTG